MGRTVKREVTITFVTTKTPEQIYNAAKPLAALADRYVLRIEREEQQPETGDRPAKIDGAGRGADLPTSGLSSHAA